MSKKFLSLEWFKERVDHSIEKVIEKKLDKLIDQEEDSSESPYKNIKLVNDILTVVLPDYSIISKPNATEEHFKAVKEAKTLSEIECIIGDNNVVSERKKQDDALKRVKSLKQGLKVLKKNDEFIVKGDVVYFKGISRSLPQLLVEKLIEVVSESTSSNIPLDENVEYLSLKRFFMWCALNPRAEVANKLYDFLTDNSFRITKQGFFIALRNVVTLHGSPELVHFISNTYNKVKAVWKKSACDYFVFLENGTYKLVTESNLYKETVIKTTVCPNCDGDGEVYNSFEVDEYEDCENCQNCDGTGDVEEYDYTVIEKIDHGKLIGNLTELYLDLPNRSENRFTDDWTKTFDIRVGKVVNMPKEDCNWSTQDCMAAGLHFTADQINYVGCGDQSVMVLINPMKVVGIGKHKGRCYEYLPFMTVQREEATKILHDEMFDTLELDEDYAIRELESLELKVKDGFVTETSKHEFNLPNISTSDIRNIIGTLEDMKKEITNRVISID
jgi:hypothetical protein